MRTLFVSDLDGTLLHSDEKISQYTCDIINELVKKGMKFSYATARSYVTSKKVTAGLNAKIPLIVYNGAMIIDNEEGTFLRKNFYDVGMDNVLKDLFENQVYPIVYSFIKGQEKFSYIPQKCTSGMEAFLETRKGDVRTNPVQNKEELLEGEIFYITCIDDEKRLKPLYEKYKDQYYCVYQRDIYSGEQWLEIMPKQATKANAIKQLQQLLECDKLVVFGDGKNDIAMFEIADEAYAVKNAVEELKQKATGIIASNEDDGVAKWLYENYKEVEE